MKCAAVSTRAVRRSRWGHNLQAGHYLRLADSSEEDAKIREAEANLQRARSRYLNVLAEWKEAVLRCSLLIRNGDVVPIERRSD